MTYPPPVPPPGGGPNGPSYYGPPPMYGYPQGMPPPPGALSYYGPPQNNGKATASLVLGIISIPAFILCSIAGIVCAIVAIVLGLKAKNEIAANPQMFKGDGIAKAGIVLGIIGVITNTLYVFVVLMFYALIILSGP